MSVLQLHVSDDVVPDLVPQPMLSTGLLLIKIGEYLEAGDIDADLEVVELRYPQIALLMATDQKQLLVLGYLDGPVLVLELDGRFGEMHHFGDSYQFSPDHVDVVGHYFQGV